MRQTGLLAQKALTYDVYRERVEKRLAKYLAFQFRINAHRKIEMERLKVATLLDNGGLHADERFPGRTRDRLESALKRLRSDGVIAEFDYVENPLQVLPARGWLKDWLQMTIWIELPELVAEHYASLRPTTRALATASRGN